MLRPKKQLAAFARVSLKAGETRRITIKADPAAASVFSGGSLQVEKGSYTVYVGPCVSDIRLSARLNSNGRQFKRTGGKLSDYLQSQSNVLTDGYTFGSVKSVLPKGKTMRDAGLTIAFVFAVIGILLLLLNAAHILNNMTAGLFAGLTASSFCLAAVGVALVFISKKMHKKAELGAEVISEENMDDKEIHAAQPYERLFEDLFDGTEEQTEEQDKPLAEDENSDAFRYYDPSLTLPLSCEKLCAFAADRGLELNAKTAKKIFSAFCSSRLVIVNGKNALLTSRLLEVLGEFFGCGSYKDEYTGYGEPENLMFRQSDGGVKEKTNIARAAFDATNRRNGLFMGVLEGVEPKDISKFFMPFSRYVNFPDSGTTIMLKNSAHVENSFRLTPNLWFVFSIKEGADIAETDAYIANMAAYLVPELGITEEKQDKKETDPFGYYQLVGLERTARANYALDEDKCWKKVDRLEAYARRFRLFGIDNKGWTRLEKFASVYLACGGEQQEALDCAVAAKLIVPIIASEEKPSQGGEYDLSSALDSIFGEDNMPESKGVTTSSAAANRR